jgi:hypothetical protein
MLFHYQSHELIGAQEIMHVLDETVSPDHYPVVRAFIFFVAEDHGKAQEWLAITEPGNDALEFARTMLMLNLSIRDADIDSAQSILNNWCDQHLRQLRAIGDTVVAYQTTLAVACVVLIETIAQNFKGSYVNDIRKLKLHLMEKFKGNHQM